MKKFIEIITSDEVISLAVAIALVTLIFGGLSYDEHRTKGSGRRQIHHDRNLQGAGHPSQHPAQMVAGW